MGGRNGVRTITRFPVDDLPVTVAGEVDFDPLDHLDAKEARRTDRFTQFGVAAAKLAWADAGDPQIVAERGGVIFATGIGGIETLLNAYDVLKTKGPGRVSPFMVPMLMANAPAGHIAMTFGLTGANFATVSACSSSNHAIFEAMRLLRDGTLDLCIAGGSESATLPLTVAAFSQMTALTKNPDPDVASRPFDAQRDGFVLSEGACALIMETEDHAKARGARIYCEVAGDGASDDAFHITAPDPKGSGAVLAMRWALEDAGAEPSQVDYINAHGTSTPLNDASEAAAITQVLGDHAAHGGRLVHEVHDRTSDGRCGSRGGRRVRAGDHQRHDPADDPLLDARSRLRARRDAEHGSQAGRRARPLELVRVRRTQHVRRVPQERLTSGFPAAATPRTSGTTGRR